MRAAARTAQRRDRRGRHGRRRTRAVIATVAVFATLAAAAIIAVVWAGSLRDEPPAASPVAGAAQQPPASSAPPLTAAEQLLATTDDPAACAVGFAGDGIDLVPVLATQDRLHEGLPIPSRDGLVFAGWYADEASAAARETAGRVNGADVVACTDRELTLHGAWITPAENEAAGSRIPILMYHQFTEKPEGEDHWLRLNVAYIGDYRAHLEYIAGGGFYLPTWDELAAFIDGRLFLPDRSVIITDDDADPSWLTLAQPLHEELGVLGTSFEITGDGAPEQNRYILRRSHTHDMHRGGADGRGLIVNATHDEVVADLQASAAALGGVTEVLAYPFGHYDDAAKQAVADAGFELARTIEQGYVRIGSDKLALPCIRIDYGMTVDDLRAKIG